MTESPHISQPLVGVLGGTGPQGRGLARRLAAGGVPILIGSRSRASAVETAEKLAVEIRGEITGSDNRDVADRSEIVVVAVPWNGHGELLADLRSELAGKIVIDCVNPLGFDSLGPFALPVPEGSAAEQAQALLPESRVVGAFHHLSASLLEDAGVGTLDTDVLVLGDDSDAIDAVIDLAGVLPGVRGFYGGRLRNAHQVEALTANLIAMNRKYRAHTGVRITDV